VGYQCRRAQDNGLQLGGLSEARRIAGRKGCLRYRPLDFSAPGRIASGPTAPRPPLRSGPPPLRGDVQPGAAPGCRTGLVCLSAVRTAYFRPDGRGCRNTFCN
jgi:hypothetical protein